VNVFAIVKLYNLSGDGLKKLIPLSNLFVFAILLLNVDTAPTKLVSIVETIVCGRDCIECVNITVEPLLSLEES
jgi:hypothetical protein